MESCVSLLISMTLLVMSKAAPNLVDLSHPHGPDDPSAFPGGPFYKLTPFFADTLESGVYVEQNYFITSGLTGAHVEAPAFLRRGGLTVDKLPLESTVAYGVMIDCSREASKVTGYKAPIQKVLDWEEKNGRIPDGAAVIFNFGWFRFYDDQNIFRGTDDLSDITTYVYPSLAFETGQFLVEKRNISILASDTWSVDEIKRNGRITDFPIHQEMLFRNRVIVEDLNNLDKLPPRGFLFSAAPVKYEGASGPQVRAYAIILNEDHNCKCESSPYRPPGRPQQHLYQSRRYLRHGHY